MQPCTRTVTSKRTHGVTSAATRLIVAGVLLAAACTAHAAVFKCAGASGPVYQELPCPAGKQLRDFAADPPPLSIIPGAELTGATPDASVARSRDKAPAKGSAERADKNKPPAKPPAEGADKKQRGDPALRRHAHTGMSDGEVLAQLGRPDITARGGPKGRTRWTYLPVSGDPETITTLYLAGGVVVDVERKLMKR